MTPVGDVGIVVGAGDKLRFVGDLLFPITAKDRFRDPLVLRPAELPRGANPGPEFHQRVLGLDGGEGQTVVDTNAGFDITKRVVLELSLGEIRQRLDHRDFVSGGDQRLVFGEDAPLPRQAVPAVEDEQIVGRVVFQIAADAEFEHRAVALAAVKTGLESAGPRVLGFDDVHAAHERTVRPDDRTTLGRGHRERRTTLGKHR